MEAYPDAVIYEAHSRRGPGKTYGFLWGCLSRDIKFIYMKRTQDDITFLSAPEFSPLKPINRDHGTNYYFSKIHEGLTGIYDEEQNLKGYALAFNAVHKFKGFDLSDVDIICVDEYIPQLTERVNHSEGKLLLDLYLTVSRDREARGRDPLKMVLFANATELFCPITETLGIVDELAEMNDTGEEVRYLSDRRILLRFIPYSASADEDTAIYQVMKGTKWADMAFFGKFAYNDFSRVKKIPLKNMVLFSNLIYNNVSYGIYRNRNNGLYYMRKTKERGNDIYDCDIEADRRRFYYTYGIMLKNEISDGNMFFSDYSAYNLLFNFNKIYKNL